MTSSSSVRTHDLGSDPAVRPYPTSSSESLTRSSHSWGADLGQGGQPLRPPPGRVEGVGTAMALDVGDERLALRVLLELGVDAERLLQELGHAAPLLPPLAQRRENRAAEAT